VISTRAELQEIVFARIGEAADLLRGDYEDDVDHDVGYAVATAILELNLTFPLNNSTLEYWAIERGKRHCYDIIRSGAAKKFRYKQIHMQQRFEQFNVLIEKMDADYMYALETNAVLAGIDGAMFTTYIKAGFVYDEYGNDVTHKLRQ